MLAAETLLRCSDEAPRGERRNSTEEMFNRWQHLRSKFSSLLSRLFVCCLHTQTRVLMLQFE
jgi:hypothetical protein